MRLMPIHLVRSVPSVSEFLSTSLPRSQQLCLLKAILKENHSREHFPETLLAPDSERSKNVCNSVLKHTVQNVDHPSTLLFHLICPFVGTCVVTLRSLLFTLFLSCGVFSTRVTTTNLTDLVENTWATLLLILQCLADGDVQFERILVLAERERSPPTTPFFELRCAKSST